MPDLPSNQSSIITAGAGMTITFTETEGGYWTISFASTASGSGHTIQDDDASLTARTNLSFQDGFVLTDDAVGDQSEVDLSYQATPSTQAFGDAAAAGTAIAVTRGDHKHAMPADPVTAHAAAADPHTGYLREATTVDFLVGTATAELTAEIAVGATPGGELGNTWASPTVDAAHSGSTHTDFIAKAFLDAKGDIISASAADTPALLTVGANDTILMADSVAASGLKWVASASPAPVAVSAVEGTADTFTRGDHVHAHEAAHVGHDTIWAAANDYVRGSANDTAVVQTASAATPAAVTTAGAAGTAANPPSADDHAHAHEAAHINHDTTWAAAGDLIVGTANDTAAVVTKGATGTFLQAGATTVAYVNVHQCPTFSKEGVLLVGTGSIRWYNDTGRTLTFLSIRASVGTAPATTSIIVDVNVDGTTIMTGTKVVIAAAANTGEQTTFSTTTIADNSYLTADIDQIGTGTLGSDLSVQIWMTG